jgi:Leucine-rich repeat (LRR) protein
MKRKSLKKKTLKRKSSKKKTLKRKSVKKNVQYGGYKLTISGGPAPGGRLVDNIVPDFSIVTELKISYLKGSNIILNGETITLSDLFQKDLNSLTKLWLKDNKINGPIPETIGQLSNLTFLDFDDNQLTGSIPESIGQLSKLTYMDLGNNQLTEHIPVSIGQLSSLNFLRFAGNQLTGPIPESIGGLSSLTELMCMNNQINGPIPETIGQLSSLIHFGFADNQLIGYIPDSITRLTKLTYMDLRENQLTGHIPETIGELSSLSYLSFENNQLTGHIPESIGELSSLSYLSFAENQLNMSIPETIGRLSNLEQLQFDYNDLSGPIPQSIGELTKLTELSFNTNDLSGPIPESVGRLSNLTLLDFENNELTGLIPESIGQLSELTHLSFENNKFSGHMPASVGILISRLKHPNSGRSLPPVLQRRISKTATDQKKQKTCYAHALSRVILNFIRTSVPETKLEYSDEIIDDCNSLYDTSKDSFINQILLKITTGGTCTETTRNNFLIFLYLYTIITKELGCLCNGYKGLLWFRENIYHQTILKEEYFALISKKYSNFTEDHSDIIISIFRIFSEKLKHLLLVININGAQSYELIMHFLRHGYYIYVSINNHALTIVGYEKRGRDIYLYMKNSWGIIQGDSFIGMEHKDGNIIEKIEDVVEKSNYFCTLST